MKKRLDQYITDLGLSPSRTKSKELIETGMVLVGESEKVITTSSFKVDPDTPVKIKSNELLKYVSRAGLKLEGALNYIGFNVENKTALDVGLSTGGFSDCLIQKNILSVVGIDVGHDQLENSLRDNPKLTYFDGINAKNIAEFSEVEECLKDQVDLIVMDVSFISQTSVVPHVVKYLKPEGHLLCLVKPQFELASKRLNKKGIVKDEQDYLVVENQIKKLYSSMELEVLDYFLSSIEGRDGNKEFFVFAKKCS